MAVQYVINNELTENAIFSAELARKCTIEVGQPFPVTISDKTGGNAIKKNQGPKSEYHQRFLSITYPDGSKVTSFKLPDVAVHHQLGDSFGSTEVYLAIPQWIVAELQKKIAAAGVNVIFQDRRLSSDDKYWWTAVKCKDAEVDKEYIRVTEVKDTGETEELYYGSFSELFKEFPSCVLANLTCDIKLNTAVPEGKELTGKEQYRAGIKLGMVDPFDVITLALPTIGMKSHSIAGKRDVMKPGLQKIRRVI